MPLVSIDARDGEGAQLRGWGLYARELAAGLEDQAAEHGFELDRIRTGGKGPELLFEQIALPRHLRRVGADLIHQFNCFLPLRRPCPGVVTVHDLAFERYPEDFARRTAWKYRTFTPRATRSAERVICVSRSTCDDVCERYGVDPANTRVVYPGPYVPIGESEPPPGPYVLAVGDLRGKKNLIRLVEAFRAARETAGLPHKLVLVGLDLGAGERIRAAAGDAPVELTGFITDERLDELMRGADLLAYPSLYEGFGSAVTDAQRRGTPVIASNITSLPEAGGDGAEYFDPVDVEDIAATLLRVLQDHELRAGMIERGRAHAATLSWERAARETAAVYAELL